MCTTRRSHSISLRTMGPLSVIKSSFTSPNYSFPVDCLALYGRASPVAVFVLPATYLHNTPPPQPITGQSTDLFIDRLNDIISNENVPCLI